MPNKPTKRATPHVHHGPYSALWVGRSGMQFGITRLDRRTKEAAFLEGMRDQLLEHVGPDPTVVERILIDRAALLSLRLAQIDAKILADKPLTIMDSNSTIAWQGALLRCLTALGVKRAGRATTKLVLDEVRYADAAE